jgi:hypothetical protein
MNDDATPREPEAPATDDSNWKRRRRLASVFGDVLPDTTSDENDADTAPDPDDDGHDGWLRSQVPPHHG